MDKVVILGKEGSFHQEASIGFFQKPIKTISTHSFVELAEKLKTRDDIKYGVMAIENSIAGTILQNYRILREHQFKIIGEKYLSIRHNLIGIAGTNISDIKEVISHPMAIYQCRDFFKPYPNIKFSETTDTVSAVVKVSKLKNKSIAAIGSALASKIYNLKIIENEIASHNINFTRFLLITKKANQTVIEDSNKASLYLRTTHQKGSLLKVLEPIKQNDINLSKLQSYPVPGEISKYYFHLDLEFDNITQYELTIKQLEKVTQELNVLGVYKREIHF